MKKFILALCAILIFCAGCQTTLPPGWDTAQPVNIGKLSNFFSDLLSGKLPVEDQVKICLVSSGVSGAVQFLTSAGAGKDVPNRLLDAVNAAQDYAAKYYPDLVKKYGDLSGIVLHAAETGLQTSDCQWIKDNASKAEMLLSLVHSVLNNGTLTQIMSLGSTEKASVLSGATK